MPYVPIDINAPLFTNLKDPSRDVLSSLRRDVLKDLAGSTYQRPGLVQFATGLGSAGCKANYYWRDKDLLYSVFGRTLYSISESGTVTQIASSVNLFANNNNPVIIVEASQPTRKLFMANGGRIIEFDGTTAQYIADVDAPTQVTHPAILDTYLLGNNLAFPERVEYSEVADPTNWQGEFISAEGKPDKLKAVHVAFREITLFGEETVEHWYNDGASPFSRIDGATLEIGTLSPYSIVQADNGFFMLDQFKRVVKIAGRQVQVLSQPIDDILGAFTGTDIDLATGEVITQNGVGLYLLRIGTKTLVFDYVAQEWVSEWNKYNTGFARYDRFRGTFFEHVTPWGITLCGDYSTGTLYKLDFDTQQDTGGILRPAWRTGHLTHGTGNEKRSNALRVRLKRGEGTPGGQEPILFVRWRDNGEQTWQNPREMLLGFTGDSNMVREEYMLGSYRSREYEFFCSENVPIAIAEVQEDVQELLY
jgi:hypothetical protein